MSEDTMTQEKPIAEVEYRSSLGEIVLKAVLPEPVQKPALEQYRKTPEGEFFDASVEHEGMRYDLRLVADHRLVRDGLEGVVGYAPGEVTDNARKAGASRVAVLHETTQEFVDEELELVPTKLDKVVIVSYGSMIPGEVMERLQDKLYRTKDGVYKNGNDTSVIVERGEDNRVVAGRLGLPGAKLVALKLGGDLSVENVERLNAVCVTLTVEYDKVREIPYDSFAETQALPPFGLEYESDEIVPDARPVEGESVAPSPFGSPDGLETLAPAPYPGENMQRPQRKVVAGDAPAPHPGQYADRAKRNLYAGIPPQARIPRSAE